MEQKEKIIQVAGTNEALYALSSEGRIYIGRLSDRGFDWRLLPAVNYENIREVPSLASHGEGSQQALSVAEDAQLPSIQREEVKEVVKPDPTTQKK